MMNVGTKNDRKSWTFTGSCLTRRVITKQRFAEILVVLLVLLGLDVLGFLNDRTIFSYRGGTL